MTRQFYIICILALGLTFGLQACSNSGFTGSNAAKKSGTSDGGDGSTSGQTGSDNDAGDGGNDLFGDSDSDGTGGDDTLGNETDQMDGGLADGNDADLEMDDEETFLPVKCTGDNGEIVFSGTQCPKYFAGFLSDDGSNTRLGCCRLPARNILDDDSDPVARGTSCAANEIAVGAQGAGFICQKINTKKYELHPPRKVCYWGNGAGGNDGASDCSNIISQLQSLISKTGDKDGCVAQPYGAVITHKTGKDCGDQKGSLIIDKETGKPVQMFPQ